MVLAWWFSHELCESWPEGKDESCLWTMELTCCFFPFARLSGHFATARSGNQSRWSKRLNSGGYSTNTTISGAPLWKRLQLVNITTSSLRFYGRQKTIVTWDYKPTYYVWGPPNCIYKAYLSGNIPGKYGQTYGSNVAPENLDPEIPMDEMASFCPNDQFLLWYSNILVS